MAHGPAWHRWPAVVRFDAVAGACLAVQADAAQVAWVEAHRKKG